MLPNRSATINIGNLSDSALGTDTEAKRQSVPVSELNPTVSKLQGRGA